MNIQNEAVKKLSDNSRKQLVGYLAEIAMRPEVLTLLNRMASAKADAAKVIQQAQEDAQKAIQEFLPTYTQDIPGNAAKMAELSQAVVDAQNLKPSDLLNGLKGTLSGNGAFVEVSTQYFGRAPIERAKKLDYVVSYYNTKSNKGFTFEPLVDDKGELTGKVKISQLERVKDGKVNSWKWVHIAEVNSDSFRKLVEKHWELLGITDLFESAAAFNRDGFGRTSAKKDISPNALVAQANGVYCDRNNVLPKLLKRI